MHLIYHANKTNGTVYLKRKVLKGQKDKYQERRFLYLFFWGKMGDNNDRTMNTRNNSCQRATGSIPYEPFS